MELKERNCYRMPKGAGPLSRDEANDLLDQLETAWYIKDNKVGREFNFTTFAGSMIFINEVARLAEAQEHHPDIHVYYNRVVIELSTHDVGGLSENDFILAARIEALEGQ